MALIDNEAQAVRLARAIASDISLYNEESIRQALAGGGPGAASGDLRAGIEEGRSHFRSRVSAAYANGSHFDAAIDEVVWKRREPSIGPRTGVESQPQTNARPTSRPGALRSTGPQEAAAVHITALVPGVRLDGRYEIVRHLGSGAMASVFEVRHLGLHSRHAFKTLNEELARNEDVVQRFLTEGRIQAQLRHTNIVAVTEMVSDPLPGLILDYVDGSDLALYMQRLGKPLQPEQAIALMLSILEGLGTAHEAGVVHRDLKPENVLLARGSRGRLQPRIADFGIAKVLGGEQIAGTKRATRVGARMGTPFYMSPEQIRGAPDVDHRSDLFAAGAILYEILTGQVAFDAGSDFDTQRRVVDGDFQPPEKLVPNLPRELAEVVKKALSPEAGARFQSCAEFQQVLATVLSGISSSPAEAGTSGRLTQPPAGLTRPVASPSAAPEPQRPERPNAGDVLEGRILHFNTSTASIELPNGAVGVAKVGDLPADLGRLFVGKSVSLPRHRVEVAGGHEGQDGQQVASRRRGVGFLPGEWEVDLVPRERPLPVRCTISSSFLSGPTLQHRTASKRAASLVAAMFFGGPPMDVLGGSWSHIPISKLDLVLFARSRRPNVPVGTRTPVRLTIQFLSGLKVIGTCTDNLMGSPTGFLLDSTNLTDAAPAWVYTHAGTAITECP